MTRKTTAYARRKRRPCLDPIRHAMDGVSKLTANEQRLLIKPGTEALDALQFGHFSGDHWRNLGDAYNIAEALAQPPVNIANDHMAKFIEAQNTLRDLVGQRLARGTWTPRSVQLQTLRDAFEIFEIQVANVCKSEWLTTLANLTNKHQQARRGNAGRNVNLVEAPI